MSCEHNDWGHMGRCVYCNELAEHVVRDLRTSLATAERGLAQWHVTHRAQLDRLEQSLATAERERDEARGKLAVAWARVQDACEHAAYPSVVSSEEATEALAALGDLIRGDQ